MCYHIRALVCQFMYFNLVYIQIFIMLYTQCKLLTRVTRQSLSMVYVICEAALCMMQFHGAVIIGIYTDYF